MKWLDWPYGYDKELRLESYDHTNPLSMLDWQTTIYEQTEKRKRERREAERNERMSLGVTLAQANHRGVWTDDER